MDTHSHLRRWGAVYVLLALFVASWAGQFVTTVIEVGNDAREHGQTFAMSDVWLRFFNATFENWQSEWLQLVLQAVVLLGMKHVLFKADAQDMEQVHLDLAEIKHELGISPRDETTARELEDARKVRSDPDS